MALYEVHARKWENGWELRIANVGVTWSPTLGDAESRAREFIASQQPQDEHPIHIDLQPYVNEGLDQLAVETRRALHTADEAIRSAAAKAKEVVLGLSEAGLSPNDIAQYLGVPQQRLEQLVQS